MARATFAISIDLEDFGIQHLLHQLEPNQLKGLLKNIGEEGVNLVHDAFEQEKNPDTGQSWAPLKPETLRRRRGVGEGPLKRTGQLLNSFHWELVDGGKAVSIGTPYPFFKYHQHLPENDHLDKHIMPRREAFPNHEPLPGAWREAFLDATWAFLDL